MNLGINIYLAGAQCKTSPLSFSVVITGLPFADESAEGEEKRRHNVFRGVSRIFAFAFAEGQWDLLHS